MRGLTGLIEVKKARVFEEQAIKKSDAREEEVLGW